MTMIMKMTMMLMIVMVMEMQAMAMALMMVIVIMKIMLMVWYSGGAKSVFFFNQGSFIKKESHGTLSLSGGMCPHSSWSLIRFL